MYNSAPGRRDKRPDARKGLQTPWIRADRQTADGSGTLDDNVVRLPRDWLGPRGRIDPRRIVSKRTSAPRRGGLGAASDGERLLGRGVIFASDRARGTTPADCDASRRTRSCRVTRRQVSALAAGAAVLVAVAVFATGGHSPNVGVARSSGTPGAASYLAMATRMSRALESVASKSGRAVANRARHAGSALAGHRSRHQTRRTVIVEQVRYVTAPTSSAGASGSTAASTPAAPTPQTSSESSSPATGSVNQPAVGANGALGPGTSPDG